MKRWTLLMLLTACGGGKISSTDEVLDADADADADVDVDGGPVTNSGFEGRIRMADGSEMPGGTNIYVLTWALADVDPTTGLPIEGATPFNTSSVSPIEDAIDMPYTVIIPDLTSEAADYRVTAHVTASITDIDTAPTGLAPEDLAASLSLATGSWLCLLYTSPSPRD